MKNSQAFALGLATGATAGVTIMYLAQKPDEVPEVAQKSRYEKIHYFLNLGNAMYIRDAIPRLVYFTDEEVNFLYKFARIYETDKDQANGIYQAHVSQPVGSMIKLMELL
jgi:hypothetical protein